MQQKIEQLVKQHLDKVLHFIAGFLLSLPIIFSWWFILLIIVVAVSKEIVDKHIRKTGFDRGDVLATCLGAVPIIEVLLIDKYVM